eukprot:3523511-Pleurochrysis_carterae.AAC.2
MAASCRRFSCCSVPLVVMRELQRQRQRTRGVTLEPKGGQEADEPQDTAEDDHGLESTFTAQSDAGEVDPNMLKYIEEQMRKDEADGAAAAKPADDEDGLYVTPAHLQGARMCHAPGHCEALLRLLSAIRSAHFGGRGARHVPVAADLRACALLRTQLVDGFARPCVRQLMWLCDATSQAQHRRHTSSCLCQRVSERFYLWKCKHNTIGISRSTCITSITADPRLECRAGAWALRGCCVGIAREHGRRSFPTPILSRYGVSVRRCAGPWGACGAR